MIQIIMPNRPTMYKADVIFAGFAQVMENWNSCAIKKEKKNPQQPQGVDKPCNQ